MSPTTPRDPRTPFSFTKAGAADDAVRDTRTASRTIARFRNRADMTAEHRATLDAARAKLREALAMIESVENDILKE